MKKYYESIPIVEEKPKIGKDVFAINNVNGWEGQCQLDIDGKWYTWVYEDEIECFPTHWLKPVNPVEALIGKWQSEIDKYEQDLVEYTELENVDVCEQIVHEISIRTRFINDLKSI